MVHEIVSFRFSDNRPVADQLERLETMGRWVKAQPGFVGRTSYYEAEQDRWIDLVTWTDLASARAAMERSQQEPTLATALGSIDLATLAMGHYERRLVSP
jgi:hypothetical protein